MNGFKKGHHFYLLKHSDETKKKLHDIAIADGRKPSFKGRKHTEESRKRMGLMAHLHASRYWKGKDRSAIFTKEYREKMSLAMKRLVSEGRHNFWKGGLTEKNKLARTRLVYKLWREAVFKRDDWTCQMCKQRGGKLEAHHIKEFSNFPDLRYDVSNGITLCKECHKKTDNYGRRLSTYGLAMGAK
jgi:hypothetical protein